MTVENLPHWTILPNWRSPVTERLAWETVILQSPSAAEQRFAVRWSPRRSFEALFTPTGRTRTLFDLAVGAVGVDPWYVPIWHDGGTLTASLPSGETTLAIDTVHREFRVGGFVMLRGSDFESEVLEVSSVTDTEIEFVAGPAQTWPAGTKVYPALKARLHQQPEMARFASRAVENLIRFEVVGDNDWTGAEAAEVTYRGDAVLTVPPNEALDITHAYLRLFDEVDNRTGIAERTHTSTIGLTVQTHNWQALGRQQHAELRSYFYTLDGRRNPTWVPTFAEDFDLAAPVISGATTIVVHRCGFTDYGGPRENRKDIEILLRDGTAIRRRITGSSLTGGGTTETVVLDAAIGQNIALADVKRISFMALSRLDTDEIEFQHITDNQGVSRTSANFRSAPDIRSAVEWIPAEPTNITKTSTPCGECIPGWTALGPSYSLWTPSDFSLTTFDAANIATDGAGGYIYPHDRVISGQRRTHVLAVDGGDVLQTATNLDVGGVNAGRSALGVFVNGNYIVVYDYNAPISDPPTLDREVHARSFDIYGDPIASSVPLLVYDPADGNRAVYGVSDAPDGTAYYVVASVGPVGDTSQQFRVRRFTEDHVADGVSDGLVHNDDVEREQFYSLRRSGSLLGWTYSAFHATGKTSRLTLVTLDAALDVVNAGVEVSDVAPTSDASFDHFIGLRAFGEGFLVMWMDCPAGEGDFTGASLRVRWFGTDGLPISASQTLYTTSVVDPTYPYIPAREARDFVVAPGGMLVVAETVSALNEVPDLVGATHLSAFSYNGVSWTQVQVSAADPALAPEVNYSGFGTSLALVGSGQGVVTFTAPYGGILAVRFTVEECS